jgi:hypothetical protein
MHALIRSKPHPNPACRPSKGYKKNAIMKQIITKIFHFSSLTPRGFSFIKKICKNIFQFKKNKFSQVHT